MGWGILPRCQAAFGPYRFAKLSRFMLEAATYSCFQNFGLLLAGVFITQGALIFGQLPYVITTLNIPLTTLRTDSELYVNHT